MVSVLNNSTINLNSTINSILVNSTIDPLLLNSTIYNVTLSNSTLLNATSEYFTFH